MKRKPSFTIRVFERDNFEHEAYVQMGGTNVFDMYVPKRTGYVPNIVNNERSHFHTWCHELGHIVCFLFGVPSHDILIEEEDVPTTGIAKMRQLIFKNEIFTTDEGLVKAEKDAWDAAEVIASFDRDKARCLETYTQPAKKFAIRQFNNLFRYNDIAKFAFKIRDGRLRES